MDRNAKHLFTVHSYRAISDLQVLSCEKKNVKMGLSFFTKTEGTVRGTLDFLLQHEVGPNVFAPTVIKFFPPKKREGWVQERVMPRLHTEIDQRSNLVI